MFLEIKIRKDGEEKWVNADKFFEYMIKEYSKVKYEGKKVDPYPDRVNKFYDNIPKELIDMWKKAYPNVDVKAELEKSRVWLLSNTNKAKKDFKGFSNRWLGKACQSGGSIPIQMEHTIEKQIVKRKEYVEQATQDSATDEERRQILNETLQKLSNKKRINK
jgi:hypothetical protein